MRRLLPICLAAALCCLASAAPAAEPRLTVTASGSVTAIPDMAVVTVGVETEAPAAKDAQDANSAAAVAVIIALREIGIGPQDFRTASFDVQPVYANASLSGGEPSVRAYRVVNRIEVTVGDLTRLGNLLDAVVEQGANRISGIRFGVADADGLRDRARTRAVAEARRRAELYADAAGVILGRLVSLSEGAAPFPGPQFEMAQSRMAVPIAPGEMEIGETVTMTWSILDE